MHPQITLYYIIFLILVIFIIISLLSYKLHNNNKRHHLQNMILISSYLDKKFIFCLIEILHEKSSKYKKLMGITDKTKEYYMLDEILLYPRIEALTDEKSLPIQQKLNDLINDKQSDLMQELIESNFVHKKFTNHEQIINLYISKINQDNFISYVRYGEIDMEEHDQETLKNCVSKLIAINI